MGVRRIAVVAALAIAVAGCGDETEEPARVPGTPDPDHAREVARNPYALTCGDLKRQPLHPESAKLVIRAEFALAHEPALRRLRHQLTLNRTGRSVYYGLTQVCKRRGASFRPGRLAIEGVLDGRYRAARNRPG
jgi:hypothetical protein